MKTSRARAVSATTRLTRPESIPEPYWRSVKALLMEIAGHYPNAYPGQDRLAKLLGAGTRSVQRWLSMAVEAGLVEVSKDRIYEGRWGSNRYSLRYLTNNSDANHRAPLVAAGPCAMGGVHKEPSYEGPLEKDEGLRPSSPSKKEKLRAAARVSMRVLPEEEPTPIGGTPKNPNRAPRPTSRQRLAAVPDRGDPPPRKKDRDPARRLLNRFLELWVEKVVDRRPEFSIIRPYDFKGEAIGYIRSVFLTPAAGPVKSEADVLLMFDQFMEAVYRGGTRIKKNQTAWKHFTGWWGRDRPGAAYEDPAVAERRFDKYRR